MVAGKKDAAGSPPLRSLFRGLFDAFLPILLTLAVYDGKRSFSSLLRADTIRVTEPHAFDLHFFGIRSGPNLLTPNEWLQRHTHWMLDLVTGIFYLLFIAIFVAMALYFRFILARSDWLRRRSRSLLWGFFWVNVLGYLTYYAYPAAPPWYVSTHGFVPADLATAPSPAGAARFDALLETTLFAEMYSRSADVFGAIPSLHVAYPMLALLHAFEFRSLRTFGVVYYVMIFFSALYLNHHYVLDLLCGSLYAGAVYLALLRRDRRLERRNSDATEN